MANQHKDPDVQAGGAAHGPVVVTAGPQGRATGNGDGKFTDVAGGFASTATQWTAPQADPAVSASFLLGWRVGLALSWAAKGARTPWPDDDPGLDEDARWSVLMGQVESAARKLAPDGADGQAPGAEDEPALPQEAPDPNAPAAALTAIKAVRKDLLRKLYVQDHFHGMAFTLGERLEALCIGGDRDELRQAIPEVSRSLLALATSLPPNAAHSVLNSLTLWSEQLRLHKGGIETDLRRQGGVWRSILAGDVAARDLLHLSDYVGTAEQVVARLHEFALKALRRHLLIPALLALAFLAGGIALLLFSHKVAAGATSVVAAFGVSWKGIGQYLGKAAAKGEQAMWNGQIDWTIAYRATISLRQPSSVSKGERAKAEWARMRRAGAPTDRERRTHYYTWQKWLRTWPDFELDR